MIELYSTNVTSTQGMVVPWNNKAVQAGSSASLNTDGQTVSINYPGIYEVAVNGYGTTTASGTFGLQLNGSGNAITRGAASTSTAAGDTGSVSFTALVKVTAASSANKATLTVTYTGSAGTINLANIVVKRIAG